MKCDGSFYFDSIKNYLDSYYSFEKEHFNLFDIFKLGRVLKLVRPDIVFSFSTTLSHYALLLKLMKALHYRLINSIRNAPVDFTMQMRLEKVLYNLYGEVAANSKAGLKAYNQSGKRGRYILYNGFDESRIPDASKIELRKRLGIDDKFTVVMVASMGDSKDQTTFINAAEQALESGNDVQFILIGDGPKKIEYLALVSSLGLEKNVLFTGEVNNVEQYLKASDLSVLISTNAEGFPNVVLESLACETPVIVTDNGGTQEVVKNNYNGYLITNGDFGTLAKKIIFLKNNLDILKYFSRNGVKTVKNYFSMEIMISRFEEIINKNLPIIEKC